MAKGICTVCNKMRGLRVTWPVCQRCWDMTATEGTRKKFGLPEPDAVLKAFRRRLKQYNRMMEAGASQNEVAALWGVHRNTVQAFVNRARNNGHEVLSRGGRPYKPNKTAGVRKTTKPHGDPPAGIWNCDCDLCREQRNKYYSSNYYKRQGRDPESPRMPRGGGRPKVTEHGTGRRGVKDCKCKKCLPLARKYARDRYAIRQEAKGRTVKPRKLKPL